MFEVKHDRRPTRRRGIPVVLIALTLASFGPWAEPARAGDALDRNALQTHVTAMAAATASGERKVYKTYLKLERFLAKPNVRGLSDDYKVLLKVSVSLAKVLADDGVLRQILDDMLDAAEAGLAQSDDDVSSYAELLPAGKSVAKVTKLADKARRFAAAARQSRMDGDEKRAISGGGKSAKTYDKALAAAVKLRNAELSGAPEWSVPIPQLDGSLLSAWNGGGPDPELFVVGANDRGEPLFLALRRFAEAWTRVPTGLTGDLWWVSGVPGSGIWASGTNGDVVRYDPATGEVDDRSTGVNATLFGIWGTSEDDVWAVGGDIFGVGPIPALLHWNGDEWTSVEAPPEADRRALFKVFGLSKNDVWACGQLGTLIHYDGVEWTSVPSGAQSALLTVHGTAPMTAVGGAGVAAVLVERDTTGLFAAKQLTPGTRALNGVFVPPSGEAIAVGFDGTVVRRTGGSWAALEGVPAGVRDFHAVWMDDEGNAVMVGGDLLAGGGGTDGVLATWGRRTLPSEIVPQARLREHVQPVLYDSCALAGCHLPPFTNEGLDFSTAEATLATAVGKQSKQSPLRIIAPGRPSQSYVWHKLNGTHVAAGGGGDRMPQGAEPLSAERLELIRAWIAEGALDN